LEPIDRRAPRIRAYAHMPDVPDAVPLAHVSGKPLEFVHQTTGALLYLPLSFLSSAATRIQTGRSVRRLLARRQTILRAAITRYASRCIIAPRCVFFVVSLLIFVPHFPLQLGSSWSCRCSCVVVSRDQRERERERASDVSSGQVVVPPVQPPLVIFRRMGTRKNGAFSRPPTSRCDEGIDQSSRASTLVILGASRVTRI